MSGEAVLGLGSTRKSTQAWDQFSSFLTSQVCDFDAARITQTFHLSAHLNHSNRVRGERSMVPRVGVEPTNLAVVDFESTASANSATWALLRTAKLENASARVHVKFSSSVLNV